MRFGEPHSFPETGSSIKLRRSGQQSYKGWSCRPSSELSNCHRIVPLSFCFN